MKTSLRNLTLAAVAALVAACTAGHDIPEKTAEKRTLTLTATIGEADDTRLSLAAEGNTLKTTWGPRAESFSLYPVAWQNVPTLMVASAADFSEDLRTATFRYAEEQDWDSTLPEVGNQSFAFYPVVADHNGPTRIPVNLTEQLGQSYNDNLERNYMYAPVQVDEEGRFGHVEFRNLTCLLGLRLKFPTQMAGTRLEQLTVSADDGLRTYGTVDITGDWPSFRLERTSGITLRGNFHIGQDGIVEAAVRLFPDDVMNLIVTARVNGQEYATLLMVEKSLEAGKWYYPNEARVMMFMGEAVEVTADHTLRINHPGALAAYLTETEFPTLIHDIVKNRTDNTLVVQGMANDYDLDALGQAIVGLAQAVETPFLPITQVKTLDMSALAVEGNGLEQGFMHSENKKSFLQKVILPPSTRRINEGAFTGCTDLTTINLGQVEEIGDWAFKGCTQLTGLDLSKVDRIWSEAFEGCKNLGQFSLPAVEVLGTATFKSATLTGFDAPLLKRLPNDAFEEATLSGTVNLPACTEIRSWAFKNVKGEFTLKLTTPEDITVSTYDPFLNSAQHITLVLNRKKKAGIVSGSKEWKGYTFKEILFE